MTAINKPQPSNPKNSADKEAAAILRQHQTTGVKAAPARTSPSNGKQGATLAGRKVSGGGKISGGRA